MLFCIKRIKAGIAFWLTSNPQIASPELQKQDKFVKPGPNLVNFICRKFITFHWLKCQTFYKQLKFPVIFIISEWIEFYMIDSWNIKTKLPWIVFFIFSQNNFCCMPHIALKHRSPPHFTKLIENSVHDVLMSKIKSIKWK